MNAIRIGACGWSYEDWSGPFYPAGLPAGEQLGFYAERYTVVEVDSTFYRCPALKTVQGWRDKTPDSFGFSLKVPQTITHGKVLHDCRSELTEFLTAARALEGKLQCYLLQFGYFNRSAFSSLEAFLQRLDPFLGGWPADVPLAVEIRNKNWLHANLFDCLRSHNTVLALTDQTWMPSPLNVIQKHDVLTGRFGYVRLLGDRAEVDALTKTLDHTVIDRGGQIRADVDAVCWLRERVPVLVFVNNHFAGYSPGTIREFLEVIELVHSLGSTGSLSKDRTPKTHS